MLATLLVTGFAFAFGWLVGREHPSPDQVERISKAARDALQAKQKRQAAWARSTGPRPRLVVSNADFPQGAA
jgi:hypothetical protein